MLKFRGDAGGDGGGETKGSGCGTGFSVFAFHVTDIAQAIEAAFKCCSSGIFNVADDEPTPPGDPIVFAARLLGVEPPQEIPFAKAPTAMTEFAASFYAEAKRVRNVKLKSVLGVKLRYPTYREGLSALHHDGDDE
jgi:nucleoside-diphosphate-sugar epimerase